MRRPLAGLAAVAIRLPPRVRLLAAIVALFLAVGAAYRFAFWMAFRDTTATVATNQLLQAWYLGAKFDLRLALLVCLPFALLGLIPWLDPFRRRWTRHLWAGYFVAAGLLVLVAYAANWGYYDYLHTGLDAGLLDHMLSVRIAAQMVWETYPVVPIVAGLIFVAGVLWWLVTRFFRTAVTSATPLTPWARRGVVAGFAVCYAFGIYGKWSWYPLRWSDAFFNDIRFVAALALNPLLFFIDTLPDRHAPYDEEAVRRDFGLVADALEIPDPKADSLRFARYADPAPHAGPPFNLVVIHLESLAAYKTGIGGNGLDPTPELDRIAARALSFSNFYVPALPTARAVFTMLTGIPDLNPTRSASRNPRIVSQHTLVTALEGYQKLYFLGGSATWANIRGILAHNLPGLRIYEEGDYEADRVDVWGVTDLDLFEKAHAVLSAESGPFFAFVQTAGNHPPYTVPDAPGFEPRVVDDATLTENGFKSLDAYNSLRFMDYALGRFLAMAQEAPYGKRTVFVLFGDHGYPSANPTPWEELGLTMVHVPFVMYAPDLVEGRRIDTPASLVDLLPTALTLMGVPYRNQTLGRDILVPRPPERRFAFFAGGLVTDDLLLKEAPDGTTRLFRYRSARATEDVALELPAEHERLARLYRALHETARYLLYHNPPQPHRTAPPHTGP